MSDHGAQLPWKCQLGVNLNPPCQHSLWKEAGANQRKLVYRNDILIIQSFNNAPYVEKYSGLKGTAQPFE
jgi:hypothetical protein